eukprot:TRINITY_DN4378_c0_g1_i2.p1 TRINITY_DN4378_c0_g1~~TRINITY_DN4378_c0_g1_i2.p1  ORF type:complete len:755 (-),score=154.48 TRINITY_DN4378_c0_g1_i2:755-3019(-)
MEERIQRRKFRPPGIVEKDEHPAVVEKDKHQKQDLDFDEMISRLTGVSSSKAVSVKTLESSSVGIKKVHSEELESRSNLKDGSITTNDTSLVNTENQPSVRRRIGNMEKLITEQNSFKREKEIGISSQPVKSLQQDNKQDKQQQLADKLDVDVWSDNNICFMQPSVKPFKPGKSYHHEKIDKVLLEEFLSAQVLEDKFDVNQKPTQDQNERNKNIIMDGKQASYNIKEEEKAESYSEDDSSEHTEMGYNCRESNEGGSGWESDSVSHYEDVYDSQQQAKVAVKPEKNISIQQAEYSNEHSENNWGLRSQSSQITEPFQDCLGEEQQPPQTDKKRGVYNNNNSPNLTNLDFDALLQIGKSVPLRQQPQQSLNSQGNQKLQAKRQFVPRQILLSQLQEQSPSKKNDQDGSLDRNDGLNPFQRMVEFKLDAGQPYAYLLAGDFEVGSEEDEAQFIPIDVVNIDDKDQAQLAREQVGRKFSMRSMEFLKDGKGLMRKKINLQTPEVVRSQEVAFKKDVESEKNVVSNVDGSNRQVNSKDRNERSNIVRSTIQITVENKKVEIKDEVQRDRLNENINESRIKQQDNDSSDWGDSDDEDEKKNPQADILASQVIDKHMQKVETSSLMSKKQAGTTVNLHSGQCKDEDRGWSDSDEEVIELQKERPSLHEAAVKVQKEDIIGGDEKQQDEGREKQGNRSQQSTVLHSNDLRRQTDSYKEEVVQKLKKFLESLETEITEQLDILKLQMSRKINGMLLELERM